MSSVRYIILAAFQRAGLRAQAGWESEAAAWIEKQGSNPCAYVGYRRGIGVAGFDNVSVVFGGNDAGASLRRVRDELEKSLEFRSERQTEVGGFPALVMTARAKKRVYSVYGGAVRPVPPTPTTGSPMYFEAVEANSTVALMSMLETAPNLEYSTDGETWQEWQHTTAEGVHTFDTITLTNVGDRVYLRGDNPNGLGAWPEGAEDELFSNFAFTGSVNCGGNVMSLLDTTMELTEVPPYGFFGLFSVDDPGAALLTPPSMDTIITIGEGGCDDMYRGCVSLTSAADMPKLTTIGYAGCDDMYSGCTSLTSAAAMPAVTSIGGLGCNSMYAVCTSLTAAANMPQLTTIGEGGCDSMYSGCTSLTAAADMPKLTTLVLGGCDSMYSGCTSLTSTAAMPAVTNIGAYGCAGMYSGCTSLTAAANMPQLTTIGDDGCYEMYSNCTFDMSDDGTTLNFDFPTPPITAGEATYATAYDVAEWMGNTNGFTEP